MDAVFYNESSALKLGWTPDWFGCSEFDEDLTQAIKDYQKSIDLKPMDFVDLNLSKDLD